MVERHIPATSSFCGSDDDDDDDDVVLHLEGDVVAVVGAATVARPCTGCGRPRLLATSGGRSPSPAALTSGGDDVRRSSRRSSPRALELGPTNSLTSPARGLHTVFFLFTVFTVLTVFTVCTYVLARGSATTGRARRGDGCEIVEGRYLHRGSPVPPPRTGPTIGARRH